MEEGSGFNIPIARPCFSGGEAEAIQQALDSGWVSQGPMVQRFEKAICRYTGAQNAVAATSWTTAFHLAFLTYGVGPGHDVICPSYSFIATANVIRYVGATPKFVDIDPSTLNIDPKRTEEFIEENYYENVDSHWMNIQTGHRLKALEIVHQIGIPADIDEFSRLAKKYNLILFEDSACAIGSEYKGQKIGGSGHPGGFSFHPRKVLTTGEGGMLVLPDEEKAQRARQLRTHGMSISDLERHSAKSTVFEEYNELGYNYKLTDIQAALGLEQLNDLESMIRRRIKIREAYDQAFRRIHSLDLLQLPDYVTRWNVQSYPIQLSERVEQSRDQLMDQLKEAGIASRRGIPPIHREPIYNQKLHLPHTDAASKNTIFLPLFPQMSDDEVKHVINTLQDLLVPKSVATS